MRWLDPRAQIACLIALVVLSVLAGQTGLLVAAAVGALALVAGRGLAVWVRVLLGLVPLVVLLVVLDALAGQTRLGLYTAARIVVLATVGIAFARTADPAGLVAGLQALRVPSEITFVLVTGARFVPTTLADLADLRDAARLRGVTVEGSPLRRLRGWSVLVVPLVVATIRRGLQLGEAMEARAFGATSRPTVRYRLHWRWTDTLAIVLCAAVVLAIALLGQSGPELA